jgi:glycine/D-amino acid oxidase-like deaminating enzyme
MEVKFRFLQEVTNFEKTKSAKLMSVDIAKVGDPDRFVEVPCHNLIVAAGSHTPEALHELVPWIEPKTSLMNIKKHCDWSRVQGHTIDDADKVGLVFHTPTGDDSVIMAGQSSEELMVASVRPRIQHVLFDDSEPEKDHFSHAATVARDHLGNNAESIKFTNGVTTISTSQNGLPLVCKIPSALIDDRFEGEHEDPLGIYIAYGFGMYGTTVSLGVATALRAMISGEDAGIGEAFDYP